MGSYDIRLDKVIDVTLNKCIQMNSIVDSSKWGLFTSNYCKNVKINNSILNRVDAHKGINNLTIKNTTIGYQGIRVVGFGKLILEFNTNDLPLNAFIVCLQVKKSILSVDKSKSLLFIVNFIVRVKLPHCFCTFPDNVYFLLESLNTG